MQYECWGLTLVSKAQISIVDKLLVVRPGERASIMTGAQTFFSSPQSPD